MQEYVIELSKYFIALFMVLYTGSCFYTFRYPVGEYSKGIFILQNILMFLVQVLCFFGSVSYRRRSSVFIFLCIYTDFSVRNDYYGFSDLREYQ